MHSVWPRFIVKTYITFRGSLLVLEDKAPPLVRQSLIGREKAVLTLHRAPLSAPSPATSPPACSRDLPEWGLCVMVKNISTVPEVLQALANDRVTRFFFLGNIFLPEGTGKFGYCKI
jgi:hypothetical protein